MQQAFMEQQQEIDKNQLILDAHLQNFEVYLQDDTNTAFTSTSPHLQHDTALLK